MPYKPKVPCKHPGCSELVEPGQKYCEKHKKMHPEEVRSAASRGYNARWRRESKKFLELHPLCQECLKNGIMPFVIAEGLRKFYYLGLDEWRQNRRARLMDVCLTGQDVFKTTTANLLSKAANNTKYADDISRRDAERCFRQD